MKKSQQYLNKFDLLGGIPLKKDSADWLVACLDPYHDYQLEPHGLPDNRTAPSVVQVHNQSYTLTKPSSASSNWDATVIFTGINSVINATTATGGLMTSSSSSLCVYDHTSLDAGNPFGALSFWAGDAGSTYYLSSPPTSGDTYSCLGSVMTTDRCRLIGVAFEIHNTTAEVYRQGSLTVAQLPDTAVDAAIVKYIDTDSSAPWGTHNFQGDRALLVGSTVQPLMSVPGSQTWPAADGCYCIPRMTELPHAINSYAMGTSTGHVGSNSRVPIVYSTEGRIGIPAPTGATPTVEVPLVLPRYPSGFSPVQVFLTGLSSQTTLTVTFRTIVEYFPALTSPLLPLAAPSSEYDPKAFEAYSILIAKIPYASKVQDNSAGDYFRKVVAAMKNVLGRAGPYLSAVSPLMGPFGPIADMAGRQMAQLRVTGPPAKALPKPPQKKK